MKEGVGVDVARTAVGCALPRPAARARMAGMAARMLVLLAALLGVIVSAGPAAALKPITLTGEQEWLDVSALGEAHEGRGDSLQIETAPAADGATARMAVRASTPGTNPNWLVFALHNPTNKVIELWLTAERYTPIGSGIVWPDLDARRIAAVTHSAGFAPERVRNDRIDVFRLTVERGQSVTFVAELASERFSRILLWKPIEFEQRQRERQLFNGIMLGITGLLAVFLTAVFAANHKSIFPMAGLVAWCALGLLCVDFGFWHKLFQMKPEDNAQYRAAAEAALAASLVMFLASFLRVNLWNGFARTLFVVWIVSQLAIVAVAVLDPRLAATVARLSLGLIGVLGIALILVLSLRGLDRALALIPTWILFLVWLFAAAVTLTGRLAGDFAISGLVSGLVLIVVLIGFTVTQYAFRSAEPLLLGSGPGGQQLRLAALDRAGAAFWEWNVRRDEFRLDAEVEATLGLNPGELPTKLDDLIAYVHPADRERFRLELLAIRERGAGSLNTGIRLRHADSSYRWLDFEGASLPSNDRRNLRCVGLVRDLTDQKRAQERLLHNAVYDSLTSLPNRELFLDRLSTALRQGAGSGRRHVTVFVIDVDRFRSVNASFGLVVGDSIILTVSRRLARIVGPEGALARIGGDQFALYLVDQTDPRELANVAERLRLSLRSPIRIAGQEIVLTGSIGIAIDSGAEQTARELMRDAEVAMHRAKRLGSDRAEIFSPELESEKAERAQLERDLAQAIDERRLTVLYQPIVALSNDELIGFEAIVRWQHPRLGIIAPSEFLPLAERADLINRLGSFVLTRAIADIHRWQQELPRLDNPLFVTVSLSSRQLISADLVQEIRQAKAKAVLPAGTIRLVIPEAVVMDNPERATHVLESLRDAGIELWLDGFGTGYSSLPYLGRFPLDTFRIDKSLVEWSSQGERDAALVRAIVAVAHELGRKVAGEGVETAEDAAFLRSLGCQFAQGFHYGEPMGESETLRLLRLIRKSERRMRSRGMVRGQEKKRPAPSTAEATGEGGRAPARPSKPSSHPNGHGSSPGQPPPARPTGYPLHPGASAPISQPVTGPVSTPSSPPSGPRAPKGAGAAPALPQVPPQRPPSMGFPTVAPGTRPSAPFSQPVAAPPNGVDGRSGLADGGPAALPGQGDPRNSAHPPTQPNGQGHPYLTASPAYPVAAPRPTAPTGQMPLLGPHVHTPAPSPHGGRTDGTQPNGPFTGAPAQPQNPASPRSRATTLSPVVAASLARLAGNAARPKTDGEDPASGRPDAPKDQGSNSGSGIKAAE